MKLFIKIVKVVIVLFFIISIIYFFYYKFCIDDKMEGSFLNDSKIEDGRFYLKTNDGCFVEIEEDQWNVVLIKTRIFMVCLIYIVVFLMVIWMRFLILPNIIKYINLLSGKFKKY